MLPLSIPTLSPFSNRCRRWKQKSDTCSKWNALMSTPLLLGTTEAFKRPMARWFVHDVTKLGILDVDAQETYHLPEHPHIENHWHNCVSSTPSQYPWPSYTPISPSNQYPQCLPIDHMPIEATPWAILTCKMPPTLIPRDDHHSSLLIQPTTSTKLKGLTFQAKTTVIVTWFKTMLYRTNSASYQAP